MLHQAWKHVSWLVLKCERMSEGYFVKTCKNTKYAPNNSNTIDNQRHAVLAL